VRFYKFTIPAYLLGVLLNAHAAELMPAGKVADQAAENEMCMRTVCQHGLHVVLKQKDGSTFDKVYDVFPGVVQPFGLTVVAGQILYIEADMGSNRLVNFRVVEAVTHPEKTLSVRLQQNDDGGMLLKVFNPFKQALKFDMGMMPLDRPRLLKTSSCPVVAGGFSVESWPMPLFQVVFGNARFIDLKGEKVACN